MIKKEKEEVPQNDRNGKLQEVEKKKDEKKNKKKEKEEIKWKDCVYTVGQGQDKKQMTIQMYDQTEEKLDENCIYYESPFGASKFTDIVEVKGPMPEP